MFQILAIQSLRVKKRCGRFFEWDPVLELVGSSFLRVPIEHRLCIY